MIETRVTDRGEKITDEDLRLIRRNERNKPFFDKLKPRIEDSVSNNVIVNIID